MSTGGYPPLHLLSTSNNRLSRVGRASIIATCTQVVGMGSGATPRVFRQSTVRVMLHLLALLNDQRPVQTVEKIQKIDHS